MMIIRLPGRVTKSIQSPLINDKRRFSSIIFPKIKPNTTGAVGEISPFQQPSHYAKGNTDANIKYRILNKITANKRQSQYHWIKQ